MTQEIERNCPQCATTNAFSRRTCRQCGAPLGGAMVRRRDLPWRAARRALGQPEVRHLGRTVAVSVATLVADAALKWLQRRVGGPLENGPAGRRKRVTRPSPGARGTVWVRRRRAVEWRDGAGNLHRAADETIWRSDEP